MLIYKPYKNHIYLGLMLQGLLYFAESESPGDNDISPIPEQGGAEVPPSMYVLIFVCYTSNKN